MCTILYNCIHLFSIQLFLPRNSGSATRLWSLSKTPFLQDLLRYRATGTIELRRSAGSALKGRVEVQYFGTQTARTEGWVELVPWSKGEHPHCVFRKPTVLASLCLLPTATLAASAATLVLLPPATRLLFRR